MAKKRTGNDFGAITRRTKRQDFEQDKDPSKRRQTTLYLDDDLIKESNKMAFELKQALDSVSRAYNRNSIIEEALRLALEDYQKNGMSSAIVLRLQKREVS